MDLAFLFKNLIVCMVNIGCMKYQTSFLLKKEFPFFSFRMHFPYFALILNLNRSVSSERMQDYGHFWCGTELLKS